MTDQGPMIAILKLDYVKNFTHEIQFIDKKIGKPHYQEAIIFFRKYKDENGKLTGYDVEIVEAVAKKANIKVEFVPTPWDSMFLGLESKKFDFIANEISKNPTNTVLQNLETLLASSIAAVATGK